MKKIYKCSVGKIDCPYWDMDSRGEEWCQSNWMVYGFERCPIPKQRNELIKERKENGN